MRAKMVDLPPPLEPTNAVVLEEGITRLRECRTLASGRDGYEKLTLLNSILPRTLESALPTGLYGSISGTLSITSKTRLAATVPCANCAKYDSDNAKPLQVATSLESKFSCNNKDGY